MKNKLDLSIKDELIVARVFRESERSFELVFADWFEEIVELNYNDDKDLSLAETVVAE